MPVTQQPAPPLPAKPVPAPPKPVVRIFVALFDYDPPTMSPNPDACDEELPFREGQLIKVYGEKDADGFYWGEAGNRTGYVPCNMVSEVQVIFYFWKLVSRIWEMTRFFNSLGVCFFIES